MRKLWWVVALLWLYVTSYIGAVSPCYITEWRQRTRTLEPAAAEQEEPDEPPTWVEPCYRWGGEAAVVFYFPVHRLDRALRRGAWSR